MLVPLTLASLGLAVASEEGDGNDLFERFHLVRALSGPKAAWLLLLNETRPDVDSTVGIAHGLREEAVRSTSLEQLCDRMNDLLTFVFVARNSGWPMREGEYWRELRAGAPSFRDLLWKSEKIDAISGRSGARMVPCFPLGVRYARPDFVSEFGTKKLFFEPKGESGTMWSFDAARRLVLVRVEEEDDRFEIFRADTVLYA